MIVPRFRAPIQRVDAHGLAGNTGLGGVVDLVAMAPDGSPDPDQVNATHVRQINIFEFLHALFWQYRHDESLRLLQRARQLCSRQMRSALCRA